MSRSLTEKSENIAFLGTGIMGTPMAAQLIKAGYDVTVWNRTTEKAAPLVAQGARLAASPDEAAGNADVLFTMLANGQAVTDLLFEQGVASALKPGSLFIDCSSIDPASARDHAKRLVEHDIAALDAPVSGGPSGAEQASLAIMVGGKAAPWARGEPILSTLGRSTLVGPPGAGQVAKLANQIIVGLAIGAVSEAFLLAAAGGVDPAAIRQAMTGGFADSLILQIHGQRMIDRTFLPGGPVQMHLKDMTNVLNEAEALGLDLPLSKSIASLFAGLSARGGGGYDHSAILLELEHRNPTARVGDKEDTLPEGN